MKEKDQETDKNKVYSTDEIREQLQASLEKTLDILSKAGVNIDEPLKANKNFKF